MNREYNNLAVYFDTFSSIPFRYPNDLSALTESEETDGPLQLEVPDRQHHVNGNDVTKKIETKDASIGVGMFCKHCGHPVDIDV